MKSLLLFLLAFVFIAPKLSAQVSADDVVGTYWTPEKDGKIRIYKKTDGKYYGKIISGKNPDRLDTKNPEPSLRNRKVVGMEFLQGFEFDGDDEWEDGEIYDPNSGSTYDCYMWLEDEGKTLAVKGFIGFSMLGRSERFERID